MATRAESEVTLSGRAAKACQNIGTEEREMSQGKSGDRSRGGREKLTASEGAKMVRLPPWRRGRRVAALVVARLAKVVKLKNESSNNEKNKQSPHRQFQALCGSLEGARVVEDALNSLGTLKSLKETSSVLTGI